MVIKQPAVPMSENNSPLDSNAVVDFLGGGLNTMSSSLNVPRGDSPYIVNMDITDKGNIASRPGSRYQARISPDVPSKGAVIVPFVAKTGGTFSIVKVADDAYLFESVYNAVTDSMAFVTRLSFSNCFAATTSLLQPDTVVITEEDIRVLFTFGIAAPVQFRVIEKQVTVTKNTTFTTTVFTGNDLEFATPSTLVLRMDGAHVPISGASFVAGIPSGSLTVTHSSMPAGTYTFELIYVIWQWICQGVLAEGKDFYQMETRFSAAQTDISSIVPVDLIKANVPVDDNRYLWPIIPYKETDRASYYTYKTNLMPNTADEFSFSNGLAYVPGVDAVVPGISHITYGALGTGIKETHFVRALKLKFDGDFAAGYDVLTKPPKVFVDGSVVGNYYAVGGVSSDTVGKAVHLRTYAAPAAAFYTNTSLAFNTYKFISFDAAPTIGIDYTAVVEVVFPYISSVFVGSGAVQQFSQVPRSGYAFPLYGIQEHADYNRGSFPRTCHLFQGRLFFGGLPAEPTKVFCTEVAGTAINGEKYTNVSIDFSNLINTDPISFIISSAEKGASITAMSDAAGSLIVFTQANSYRVFSSNALGPTNFSVSTVAAVGCVNAHCVVPINNSVTFLSLSGVYRLSPALQVGDFDIALLSIKVNNILKQQRNSDVAWMFYDDIENRLYLGITDSPTACVANRMLVYSVQWEAWTEYTFYTGYWCAAYGAPIKINRSYQVFFTCFDYELRTAQTCFIVSTGEKNLATDFTIDGSNWTSAKVSNFNKLPYVRYRNTLTTPDPYVRLKTFKLLDYPDVRDAVVVLNGVVIEGWKKLSSTLIQITARIAATDIVEIYPKNDLGDYPILLYQDNVWSRNYNVTVSDTLGLAIADFEVEPAIQSKYRLALSIPFAFSTGVYTRSNLTGDKLHVDMFVLCYNVEYQARFAGSDVNTAVAQDFNELIGLFKLPVGLKLGKCINGIDYVAVAEDLNPSINFDLDRADTGGLARQTQSYARLGTALKGSEDVVQGYAYTYNFRVFCLTAYQLVAKSIGRSTK